MMNVDLLAWPVLLSDNYKWLQNRRGEKMHWLEASASCLKKVNYLIVTFSVCRGFTPSQKSITVFKFFIATSSLSRTCFHVVKHSQNVRYTSLGPFLTSKEWIKRGNYTWNEMVQCTNGIFFSYFKWDSFYRRISIRSVLIKCLVN